MRLVLFALALLAALTACRRDDPTSSVVPPPLRVRFTSPIDTTANVFTGGPIPISVTFRSDVSLDDVEIGLFPAPVSSGQKTQGISARTITWTDVLLDPDQVGYTVLVDSPHMLTPYRFRFLPGEWTETYGRLGGCVTATDGRPLGDVVVFAIDPGQEGTSEAAIPDLFHDRHAQSISLTTRVPGQCDSFYWMQYLKIDVRYLLVAVLDTDGNADYDLYDDWWGFYPTPLFPAVTFAPVGIDIEIAPPRQG